MNVHFILIRRGPTYELSYKTAKMNIQNENWPLIQPSDVVRISSLYNIKNWSVGVGFSSNNNITVSNLQINLKPRQVKI